MNDENPKHKMYHIVAIDAEMGMGKDGKLPWDLKNELAYFQKITLHTKDPEKKNMLIMGRTTWESIPENHRPLKGRVNVVLTRNPEFEAEGAIVKNSFDDAYDLADESIETIYIIGGAQLFKHTLEDNRLTGLYITKIHNTYDCDTFFPQIPEVFSKVIPNGSGEDDGVKYDFLIYKKED